MSNHRSQCHYCKTDVLSRDIGSHILRKHEKDLFSDKDNLKNLYRDKYVKEPLQLSIGVDTFFFCLADKSCIRKGVTALQHFKGKADKHREAIVTLREKYPQDGGSPSEETVVRREYLSDTETKLVQDVMAQVVAADTVGFSKKDKAVFTKLGIFLETQKIKEMYPQLFPDEEEPEEEEEEEEHPPPPPPKEESEKVSFNDKTITHTAPPASVTPTAQRQNYQMMKPSQSTQPPQLKIISNTKLPR